MSDRTREAIAARQERKRIALEPPKRTTRKTDIKTEEKGEPEGQS